MNHDKVDELSRRAKFLNNMIGFNKFGIDLTNSVLNKESEDRKRQRITSFEKSIKRLEGELESVNEEKLRELEPIT